jgi:transposase
MHLYADHYSQRRIADTVHVSRNTVSSVIAAAVRENLSAADAEKFDEAVLYQRLFPEKAMIPVQLEPEYDRIHKELLRSGVNLRLLWEEYVDVCRESKQPPYMYSQFCKKYADYVNRNRLTMHIQHKPGDKLMVDWAGTKLQIYDQMQSETIDCFLFVATLPFSMYCYAEACLTMQEEDWINAHIHMFECFGGSARILVSDNLKAGVIRNRKHEDPVFNRCYQEMADHYRTALLPARILAPKDKAAVEGTVGQLTSHIIAKLRNRRFFSLAELNDAVKKELDKFNRADFQKREGSRYSVYLDEELGFMQPLPETPYEFASWKSATVQLNYHVSIENQNYSVPYAYARKKVEIRSAKNVIEIYYQGNRICSHRRLHGRKGQYDTNPDHMPVNHQLYSEWNKDRFLHWAETIGPSTKEVVTKIFSSYRVEEQAYKGCLSLLKLADKYSAERLEKACRTALVHIPSPRYRNIRLILEAGQDTTRITPHSIPGCDPVNRYTHLRGAAYYGGNQHEQ